MDFQITLADRVIELHTQYHMTYDLCLDYLCENQIPDISITIMKEDLLRERYTAVQTDAEEGRNPGQYSDDYLETLAVYRNIAEEMLNFDTFLMHGSVIASPLPKTDCYDNQESVYEAVMFTARSGVGKTTRTTMWLNAVSGSYVVNGDKPLLHISDSGVIACGTPWAGKENLQKNCSVPLRAIILLERGEENNIEKLPFSEAFSMVLQQTYRPKDSSSMIQTLRLVQQMAKYVGFYRFRSNLEKNAIELAYQTVYSSFEGEDL